ncbi:hypothetical protein PR048_008858 [Dryococelus australis]|uniref:Uncharacterized protein n=1 Tax=Dryococelus australis TaxID=614101 RepID=A0ABQ9HZ67_9NEOP|nr:hypothetical protein PR048_008858 [Dryococelus australis]
MLLLSSTHEKASRKWKCLDRSDRWKHVFQTDPQLMKQDHVGKMTASTDSLGRDGYLPNEMEIRSCMAIISVMQNNVDGDGSKEHDYTLTFVAISLSEGTPIKSRAELLKDDECARHDISRGLSSEPKSYHSKKKERVDGVVLSLVDQYDELVNVRNEEITLVHLVAERLASRLPPRRSGFNPGPGLSGFSQVGNNAGRCRWSAGSLSRGSPVSPAPSFWRRSILTSITNLDVKSGPNLFTHSLNV